MEQRDQDKQPGVPPSKRQTRSGRKSPKRTNSQYERLSGVGPSSPSGAASLRIFTPWALTIRPSRRFSDTPTWADDERVRQVRERIASNRDGFAIRKAGNMQRPCNESAGADSVTRVNDCSTRNYWSREWELNPRPADYESAALPLSYLGPIVGSHSTIGCCAFSVDRPLRIWCKV